MFGFPLEQSRQEIGEELSTEVSPLTELERAKLKEWSSEQSYLAELGHRVKTSDLVLALLIQKYEELVQELETEVNHWRAEDYNRQADSYYRLDQE